MKLPDKTVIHKKLYKITYSRIHNHQLTTRNKEIIIYAPRILYRSSPREVATPIGMLNHKNIMMMLILRHLRE